MNLATRMAALRGDAQAAAAPRLARIHEALAVIEAEVAGLSDDGFTVDVRWPYGRGSGSLPTATKVDLKLAVSL